MEELQLACDILADIEDNDVAFAEALRKVFVANVDKRPLRSVVAGLLGCELRHHMLFSYLLDPLGLEPEQKRLSRLALADCFFYHRLDLDAVKEEVSTRLGEKASDVLKLFEKAGNADTLLPESMSRTSNEYLSLRYNTPVGMLKMWQYFGYGTSYKLLRHFSRPAVNYYRVRKSENVDDVVKFDGFKKTSVDRVLSYTGKSPIRKCPLFAENKIFQIKPVIKSIVDAHKLSEPAELLCYVSSHNNELEEEILEAYGDTLGINLGVHSLKEKFQVGNAIRRKNLHNVNFFEADPAAMTASISKPCELVLCYPESTDFDSINQTPDFFLHFKKENIDSLLEGQKNALEGCAKHVSDHGTLIYMVSTIDKKEGRGIVSAFLHSHSDFKLEGDIQHFPTKEGESAFYEATLVKNPEVKKDPEPIADMIPGNITDRASIQAKGE